jgi:hypothetical protein
MTTLVASQPHQPIAHVPKRCGGIATWLSYQRYATLFGIAPLGLTGAIAWFLPHLWWLWGLTALGALPLLFFAGKIYARYPVKVLSTRRARGQILNGTFEPSSVQPLCADPCSRVVAERILRMAKMPRAERHRVIRELGRRERQEGTGLVFVDESGHVVSTYNGQTITHNSISENKKENDYGD